MKKIPVFDRLPVWAQHLLVGLAATTLGLVGTEVVPAFEDKNPALAVLLGTLATLLLGALTPLTRQYGTGAPAPQDGRHEAGAAQQAPPETGLYPAGDGLGLVTAEHRGQWQHDIPWTSPDDGPA